MLSLSVWNEETFSISTGWAWAILNLIASKEAALAAHFYFLHLLSSYLHKFTIC